mgnify:CR=1 FL=1|jgi:hypothetical protein
MVVLRTGNFKGLNTIRVDVLDVLNMMIIDTSLPKPIVIPFFRSVLSKSPWIV